MRNARQHIVLGMAEQKPTDGLTEQVAFPSKYWTVFLAVNHENIRD